MFVITLKHQDSITAGSVCNVVVRDGMWLHIVDEHDNQAWIYQEDVEDIS